MNYKYQVINFASKLNENSLFNDSGASPFGWLFREFIFLTLKEGVVLNERLCECVELKLSSYEDQFASNILATYKPYLQLVCFYLSYRNYFDSYRYVSEPLNFIVSLNVRDYLVTNGCTAGKPGSGNLAMFLAIIIFNDKNNKNDERLETWFEVMNDSQNSYGLWGSSHILYQLQNGYHQYEIYKFFGRNAKFDLATEKILKLQDEEGHFGPFKGGGGCYDFDAIDLLINYCADKDDITPSLEKLYKTLLKEQRADGGFCESPYINYDVNSAASLLSYVVKNLNIPRLKFLIRFSLGQVKVLQTHWSLNHRKYTESDSWNTWFRLITILKIEAYLNQTSDKSKLFNFPGIGF